MSQDDIVFDEVKYREPVRLRRPDRDRRWACLAYEVPGPGDLPVFLDRATADAIERHALRDTTVELGGILLGKECLDDQTGECFVWVTESLEAKHYENTQASLTYTHDSWEEITRERDRLHPDLDIVGWYHTHPDFGIFLSSHDLFIQHHFFGQPLQVAYVVDPIRQTRGFFRWRDGVMEQTGGFYLTASRDERTALARLVNDLENVTDAGSTGNTGLSPRLEAELIAMLTRPSSAHQGMSAADRAQTALLFGLVGAMVGVLGVAAVLWISTLNAQIQEQSVVLRDLGKVVADSADRQRITLDAAVGDAAGTDPKEFLDRYARSIRERDDARRKLDNQAQVNDSLAEKLKLLTNEETRLRKELDKASTFERDAKQTVELRAENLELAENKEKQKSRIDELESLLETPNGQKNLALARRADNLWYVAAGGWGLSLILTLALIGLYAYGNNAMTGEPELPPPNPAEPPPHHIS